jgi:hypothetical protein
MMDRKGDRTLKDLQEMKDTAWAAAQAAWHAAMVATRLGWDGWAKQAEDAAGVAAKTAWAVEAEIVQSL